MMIGPLHEAPHQEQYTLPNMFLQLEHIPTFAARLVREHCTSTGTSSTRASVLNDMLISASRHQ